MDLDGFSGHGLAWDGCGIFQQLLCISSSFLCSVASAPLSALLAVCASRCPLSSLFPWSCSTPSSILRTTSRLLCGNYIPRHHPDEWKGWRFEEPSGACLKFVFLKSISGLGQWEAIPDHFGGLMCSGVLSQPHTPLPSCSLSQSLGGKSSQSTDGEISSGGSSY